MKRSMNYLLLLVFLIFSCSDNNVDAPLTGTIKGKVINSYTQSPESNVLISTIPSTESLLTDENGMYEINDIEEGEYTVIAQKENFAKGEVKVSVKAGKITEANFLLIDTVNGKHGSITGTVVDYKTNEALSEVYIYTIPATITAKTDESGKFTIERIPIGRYSLVFQKADYNSKTINVVVESQRTAEVFVKMLDKESANNPPNTPILLLPLDETTSPDSVITLTWECDDPDNDVLTYDVYVSTSYPPETKIAENIKTNSFKFYASEELVDYYWKVIAKDGYGAFSESDVWSFKYYKSEGSDAGLILYYTFDNGNAADESGNDNDGQLKNGVTFTTGRIGKAAHLIGTPGLDGEGSHILLPSIDFRNLGDFSISIWIKERQLQYFAGEAYINWGNASTGWIGISNFVKPPENQELVVNFSVGCTASNNYENQQPVWVPYDVSYRYKWVHYALVYKNGVTSGYINGELVGVKTHKLGFIEYNYAAIGKHWWNYGGTKSATSMDFDVDEVRVYNRALSDSEIKALAK